MMNRKGFSTKFNEIMRNHGRDCANDEHPLWEAEKRSTPRIFCKWFVCVKPLTVFDASERQDYWTWVRETLRGQVVCFSSDLNAKEEWWGFTNKKDALIWMLKWGS